MAHLAEQFLKTHRLVGQLPLQRTLADVQTLGYDVNHQALLQQPLGRFFAHAGRCAGDEGHLWFGECG
jgi:hypothetical protein